MELERTPPTLDFGDKTVIMRNPTQARPQWQPVATTLRMIPTARPVQGPPVPMPPAPTRMQSPSVPALVCDADATDEIERARAQMRKRTSPWTVLAGVLIAAGIFGGMMAVGSPAATRAAASAPPPDTSDGVLERERAVRAARAQGQWVELNDVPAPTPSSTVLYPCTTPLPGAPTAPCAPPVSPLAHR